MDNDNFIRAIEMWQIGPFHPLTCGRDSSHEVLKATDDGLICPVCGWKQPYALVPKVVWEYYKWKEGEA
jgi:hypothetical protein